MYLKRLEIRGFKSFPEKTGLDFTTGITTVVGPNGSGKSNIADAARWALGEMSVKSLRGGKMEDIIFCGTQNRRPGPFAEVSLLIDNADKRMPIEFTEVKLTRRVYRTGEGEFLINNKNCRLKDICEMLMDTGLGREGYSIVGQGRIDEILNAKSEERRLLFEEAAGIVKYRSRKTEAQGKLEKEKQNLTRVNDIINEIEGTLLPLLEQADKAKMFLSQSQRLKLVQINIFLLEAAGSQDKIESLTNGINELNAQISETAEEEAGVLDRSRDLKHEYARQSLTIKDLNDAEGELKLSIEKSENNIRVFTERIAHTDRDTTRLNDEIEKKQAEISAKDKVREGFIKHRLALTQNLEALNRDQSFYQADFDKVSSALQESENKMNTYNQGIYDKMNEISDNRGLSEKLQASYEQLEEKKELLNAESMENNDKTLTQTERESALQNEIETVTKGINEIKNKLSFYDSEAAAVKTRTVSEEAALQGARKAYDTAKARLKLLKELEDSLEGYSKSVKAILTRKRNEGAFLNIQGAVANLLSTKPMYETAIEVAVGGFMQNLVTLTEEDSKEAIEYLKTNKLGRATFLPLSAIQPKDMGKLRDSLKNEPGFIAIAKELINYDEVYEGVFSHILGKTVVCDNFGNAVSIFKKYRYAIKIVTLGGELLNTGGAITGGAAEVTGAGLFGRSREIKTLTADTEELRQKRDALTQLIEGLNNQLQGIDIKREELSKELGGANISIASLSRELEQVKQTLTALNNRRDIIKEEDEDLFNRIVSVNKQIREVNAAVSNCEQELTEIKNNLARFKDELAAGREERDIKVKRLMDLKADLASAAEKLKSTDLNIERLREERDAQLLEIEKRVNEQGDLAQKKALLEESIIKENMIISGLNQNLTETGEKLISAADTLTEINKRIADTEERQANINRTKTALQNELTKQTLRLEQAEEETRRLYDLMWDEYELTYNTAKEYERIEKTEKELIAEEKTIKNSIKELGSVNVGAIEEYKQKKERYDFLTAQRDDILKAEDALDKLIRELNAQMEAQFRQQLAVISDNFNAVFSEMFGGGAASASFTDPLNVLESGIEITARPPGKTLRVLTLLSGGEKTLTAMALLFAILRMKPSPFCLLDEIDAALDEANVARFTNFLKNYSKETQFILISHKKGTMAIADALYGVTMQEQGVSKLVSVNLVS